jgi:hypothetical protein
MSKKFKKKPVLRLFELQTPIGIHIWWADSEDEVKKFIDHNTTYPDIKVYQHIGSFETIKPLMKWQKLQR